MSRKEITMATQESITNLIDVNISFVIPSKYQSDKECSDDMWLAYNVSFWLIFLFMLILLIIFIM